MSTTAHPWPRGADSFQQAWILLARRALWSSVWREGRLWQGWSLEGEAGDPGL